MTEKETVEYFREMTGEYAAAYELCPCFSDHKEMAKIALAALEKQIPQKPHIEIIFGETDSPIQITGTCPICHCLVRSTENNYCGFCGQTLDWSEYNG